MKFEAVGVPLAWMLRFVPVKVYNFDTNEVEISIKVLSEFLIIKL